MTNELIDLVERLGHPKVLVVGDLMLDRYIFGNVERISQEAPVPVLHADRQENRLGGAASVASMLTCLESEVTLLGLLGADDAGRAAQDLLRQWAIPDQYVFVDADRPTTCKERFIGRAQDRHPQQILRVDRELCTPLASEWEARLIQAVSSAVKDCEIVLVSDYAKGVCTPDLLAHLIDRARTLGRRVLVDPIRRADYGRYRGATCLTPNRTEAQLAAGLPVATKEQALIAGERLLQELGAEAVVVTLDREGMALIHADGRRATFPTRPRQVYDVTGAGDMVLSVLGLCLAAGASYDQAITLSNIAAGLEVERLGVATVSRVELLQELSVAAASQTTKLWRADALEGELERRRRWGQRIVFTNGCFDVVHSGHVECLQQARSLGDILVVGINSDASVRRLKGCDRPLNSVAHRAQVLAALACVDYVVVFEEDSPVSLLRAFRPHVLVKGGDYRPDQIVGREIVESYGGQAVIVPQVPGQSTTRLARHVHKPVAIGPQRAGTPNQGTDDGKSNAVT